MAVNPVTTGQSGLTKGAAVSNVATAGVTTTTAKDSQTVMVSEAAVYEKSDQTQASAKTGYTMDTATLNEIAKQVEEKFAYLRATVENLFSMQNVKTGEAQGLAYEQIMEKYNGKLKEFYENLEVDEKTSLAAQQEIAEDGFWGVKQTSQRAIEFAIALSGGDTSKVELLKNAIVEGYKAAEAAWGGELPEICKQTQEATLKGLDEWAKPTTPVKE
ncbi:MAG: hypothetical protein H6Q72_4665 [Firmicutes bacterium]|nr:hypothetical protein [Bacillota bacterium]